MLDTHFPRVPGDVGNAKTWPFAVDFEIVSGVGVKQAVRDLDYASLEPLFVDAMQRLEGRGAAMITTSCGFLILLQNALQAAARVPVFTSSLLSVPLIASGFAPGRKVGILTFEAASLQASHFAAAGVDASGVVVAGMEGTAFHKTIAEDLDTLDVEQARRDHVAVASNMVSDHPEVAAFVLECTNMPPYAAAIRAAIGLPVYDITTLVRAIAGFTGTT